MPLTLTDVSWPRRTARLSIHRARPGDADAVFAYRCRPEVADWTTSHARDPEAWRARYRDDDVLGAMLTLRHRGEVVGDAMLLLDDAWSQVETVSDAAGVQAEVGFALHPDHQGRGFATETLQALIDLAFDELGLRRVVAGTYVANERSWAVMERCGMRRESTTLRSHLHRSRGWLDGCEYAVLADEWAARAQALTA